MLAESVYHKTVRSSAVVMALVLLFDSGIISHTTYELSKNAQQSLASVVSVAASVPPNELNVITAELQKQKSQLDAREREIDARATAQTTQNDGVSTYALSGVLFLLLCLILLNYILDFIRANKLSRLRAQTMSQTVVNAS